MNFKRGILCGLLVIVCSIGGIFGQGPEYGETGWIFWLAFALGVVQFIVSFNYQKPYKKRALALCFGLEGIYYAVSMIVLLIQDTVFKVKIFGIAVGIGMLVFIITSVMALYNKRNMKFGDNT